MDAPPIQYARTEDGVNIAYWTLGEGPPLIYVPNPSASHAEMLWEIPASRAWFERLSAGRRVIYLDPRGTGLSDGAPSDYSVAGFARDIEAVAAASGTRRFALWGDSYAAAPAISTAVNESLSVERLILWHGSLDLAFQSEVATLADRSWDVIVDLVIPGLIAAGGDAELTAALQEMHRQSISQDSLSAWITARLAA
jgi:pimeloyl-ACP methyl ester carboxylesterase